MTWDNVDLDKAELRIERSLGCCSAGLVVHLPKSERGRRTIKLPEVVGGVLRQHLLRQTEQKARYHNIYEDNNLVFANEVGGFVNPMNFTRVVKALGEKLGNANVRGRGPSRSLNDERAIETNHGFLIDTGLEIYRPSVYQSRQNHREHVVADNDFESENPVKHKANHRLRGSAPRHHFPRFPT